MTKGNDSVVGYGEEGHDEYQQGLTKIELMAIEAMNAMLSNPSPVFLGMTPAGIAKAAVHQARILIEELNKGIK